MIFRHILKGITRHRSHTVAVSLHSIDLVAFIGCDGKCLASSVRYLHNAVRGHTSRISRGYRDEMRCCIDCPYGYGDRRSK